MNKAFLIDLLERAVKTFLQAVLSAWVVGAQVLEVDKLDSWRSLVVAGVAAGVSALTSFLSRLRGDGDSASLVE